MGIRRSPWTLMAAGWSGRTSVIRWAVTAARSPLLPGAAASLAISASTL